MAKVLDPASVELLSLRQSFPWDIWTDGQVWELTAGDDFENQTPAEFRSRLYAVAKRRGLIVRTKVTSETIIFQFLDDPNYVPAEDPEVV